MSAPEKLVLNGAVSQLDRWLEALGPGYARVDDWSLSERLDFAVQLGGLIKFFNLDDRVDGDWVEFFLTDPAMVLACLGGLEPAELEAGWIRLRRQTAAARPFERRFDLLREMFTLILGLARQIDGWLRTLDRSPDSGTARLARQEIAAAIRGELSGALRQLEAYDRGAGQSGALGRPIGLDYSGLLPIWNLDDVCADGSIYKGSSGSRKILNALPYLSPLFEDFLYTLAELAQFARENLPVTLADGQHKPQTALYIAFAQLFETAQETLNTFSARYARFYDRDVLREGLLPAVPARVYLTFTLAADEDVLRATVPAGTLFPAGQDAGGMDILYAADQSLAVTTAQVASIRTLRVLSGPLVTGGEPAIPPAAVPWRILASEIPLDAAVTGAWATFGESELEPAGPAVTGLAALGFAIASPYLLLAGGLRIVETGVRFSRVFQEEVLAPRLLELAGATGLDEEVILLRVLAGAFDLYLSTAAGWLAAESYGALLPAPGEPFFALTLNLPASVPPIAPFDPEAGTEDATAAAPVTADPAVTATNPAPGLPTLKAYLRQEPVVLSGPAGAVEVYPLSLLDGMEVEAFRIATWVSGLQGLVLENTDGEVDPATPFPLFGAIPVAGSYVQVCHPELFVKTPDSLAIGLRWFGLPPYDDGFQGYYRDYVIGLSGKIEPGLFDNQTFQGVWSVQNPGAWVLESASPPGQGSPPGADVFLFRTRPDCGDPVPAPDGPLCPETGFNTLEVYPLSAGAPPYYDPAASALRLELMQPAYAFGNDLYSKNVLNAVIADLPDPQRCQQQCLAECRPLKQGALCIEVCLASCLDLPDDFYQACIQGPLADCMACLESLELTEALLCVEACAAGCAEDPAGYKACLRAGLQTCKEGLEKAYEACFEACMTGCMSLKKELRYPNEPWLPVAESLTVDYTAGCDLPVETAGEGCGQLFHLLPFGGYRRLGSPGEAVTLLPRFPGAGHLYLGFSGLIPPQTLTLLFQMAAGGAPLTEPPPVVWQYLSGNRWWPLQLASIPTDLTHGLQSSGIFGLSLPAYDPAGNTVLAADLQWLQAAVERDPDALPPTIALSPHALTATWQAGGGAGELATPLPAQTITSSVQDLPDIEAIGQPLESFGGRPPETERNFAVRLGERLRHKDRAILGWDYERLVLERFPTVWKVQALPARSLQGGNAPGHVLVVIVPGPDSLQAMDPTAPLAPGDHLGRIQDELESLASPFVRVRVVNPQYVRIEVTAAVKLADGIEPGAGIERLNDELVRYLSPWFYDAARAAKAGRYVSEGDIAEFIQTRPYIAALDAIGFRYEPDPETLEWYFLTSAHQHQIQMAVEPIPVDPCRY